MGSHARSGTSYPESPYTTQILLVGLITLPDSSVKVCDETERAILSEDVCELLAIFDWYQISRRIFAVHKL
jgi:hypothetical protein